LADTRDQGCVPLICRTPRCQLEKSEVYDKIRNLLAIDEDTTQEEDLLKLYLQALN
jgi:hypothetical protein